MIVALIVPIRARAGLRARARGGGVLPGAEQSASSGESVSARVLACRHRRAACSVVAAASPLARKVGFAPSRANRSRPLAFGQHSARGCGRARPHPRGRGQALDAGVAGALAASCGRLCIARDRAAGVLAVDGQAPHDRGRSAARVRRARAASRSQRCAGERAGGWLTRGARRAGCARDRIRQPGAGGAAHEARARAVSRGVQSQTW